MSRLLPATGLISNPVQKSRCQSLVATATSVAAGTIHSRTPAAAGSRRSPICHRIANSRNRGAAGTVPTYSIFEKAIFSDGSTAAASKAANSVHQTTHVIIATKVLPPGLACRCRASAITTREIAAASARAVANGVIRNAIPTILPRSAQLHH